MLHNNLFGRRGEDFVVDYLKGQGYSVLARNYRTSYGEIDIIVQKKNVLAFVEVKLRQKNLVPLELLISEQKQRKIENTARLFIAKNNVGSELFFRFDVALVNLSNEENIECSYIESAFDSHE